MSDWVGGFVTGVVLGIPVWGSLGALVIVLVASAKRLSRDGHEP
jgi:hypothetical protein